MHKHQTCPYTSPLSPPTLGGFCLCLTLSSIISAGNRPVMQWYYAKHTPTCTSSASFQIVTQESVAENHAWNRTVATCDIKVIQMYVSATVYTCTS